MGNQCRECTPFQQICLKDNHNPEQLAEENQPYPIQFKNRSPQKVDVTNTDIDVDNLTTTRLTTFQNLKQWIKIGSDHYKYGDSTLNGDFSANMQHTEGQGEYISPQVTFNGTWKHALPYSGVIKYQDGTTLTLKSTSQGSINWPNSRTYTGQLRDYKPNGSGLMQIQNGDSYSGQFFNGIFHGKGLYKWKSGATFEGAYIVGLRHGKGVYTNTSNIEYRGSWLKGEYIPETPRQSSNFQKQHGELISITRRATSLELQKIPEQKQLGSK